MSAVQTVFRSATLRASSMATSATRHASCHLRCRNRRRTRVIRLDRAGNGISASARFWILAKVSSVSSHARSLFVAIYILAKPSRALFRTSSTLLSTRLRSIPSALSNLPVSKYRCPRLFRTVDSEVPESTPNFLARFRCSPANSRLELKNSMQKALISHS